MNIITIVHIHPTIYSKREILVFHYIQLQKRENGDIYGPADYTEPDSKEHQGGGGFHTYESTVKK